MTASELFNYDISDDDTRDQLAVVEEKEQDDGGTPRGLLRNIQHRGRKVLIDFLSSGDDSSAQLNVVDEVDDSDPSDAEEVVDSDVSVGLTQNVRRLGRVRIEESDADE